MLVVADEGVFVGRDLGGEVARREPVAVPREALIALFDARDREGWDVDPDDVDGRRRAHLEGEPANRRGIRQRRRGDVGVERAVEVGTALAVGPPEALWRASDRQPTQATRAIGI